MRVGLLIYGSLETISGGYLYDRLLVESLRAAGDSVEVISLPWRSYPQHLADNFSKQVYQRLASLDADVLIQDELNHPSLFRLNERLKTTVAYPVVSLVHHLRSSESHSALWLPFYRAIEKRYLDTVDAFIFNSRTTRGVVESLTGAQRPAVVATPAGDRLGLQIGEEAIRARAVLHGPLRLLFLGSLIPRKHLHTVFEALRRLPSKDWTLTIAGSLAADARYARQMVQQAARHGWGGQVEFCGPLNDDQLCRVLLESHLLVLPSQYEGFGIAYLEGMSAGLPAIASTNGAAHEVIRSGEWGFLIGPGDSVELARHLHRFQRDRAYLADMGVAARAAFETFPGWTESMQRIRQFLTDFTGCA